MQLIAPFLPLLQGGVILTLRISAGARDRIQLDILPQGKDSATGVALPPRALVGTAQELDEHLETYLQKYANSVARVVNIVAGADAELQAIEEAASAQARKAVADRSRTRTPPKGGAGAHADRTPPGSDDADCEDEAPLLSTPAGSAGSSDAGLPGLAPEAPCGDGITHELFVS